MNGVPLKVVSALFGHVNEIFIIFHINKRKTSKLINPPKAKIPDNSHIIGDFLELMDGELWRKCVSA